MARTCDRCGKGSQKSASRSHSNIKTIRRQYPNLQKVGDNKLCTRCIRTLAKPTA